MKVTVIGARVIGLCCAYYLQKEGHEVTYQLLVLRNSN
jgi:glycine/D-amino acid oxidase-like deaminating enzyme